MIFAAGYYAHGFWVCPALILFFIWAEKNRKSALSRFAEKRLLGKIASSASPKKRVAKFGMLILVFLLSTTALMRPQWGFRWEEVKREALDILIAIDVSKSMLATDTRPNRLEKSKLAVKDLIKKLRGDRIGLIAFSGTAYLQCPLTIDYGGFLLALNDLRVGTIPRGGTSLSSAIKEAAKAFEGNKNKDKALIIITDGEDHEGSAHAFAEKASKAGIKIFCIGIGTQNGELIQLVGKNGERSFLKDRSGNVVKSRLNEEALKDIALATGGAYIRASGAEFGLDFIYERKLSKMQKEEIKARMQKLYFERFQIPLAAAFLLLFLEIFISDGKKR